MCRADLVDVVVCYKYKPILFLLLFLVLQLAGHWPAPPTKPLPPDPTPSESKMQCKVEGALAAIAAMFNCLCYFVLTQSVYVQKLTPCSQQWSESLCGFACGGVLVSLSFWFNSEMIVLCACGWVDGSSGVNGVCRDPSAL